MALNSSTVAAGDTVTAAQRNNLRKDVIGCGVDFATSGGSANAQTLAIDSQYVAHRAGDSIKFTAGFTNTGAATFNINSIGALAIQKQGLALTGGEIVKGEIIEVVYDGAVFQLKHSGRMIGEMAIWPTNTAPAGWLLCYGQVISTTTYAALYSIIGHTFAADPGGGNFTLPDMRGRIPLGQDDMGGASANRVTSAQADSIGGVDGAETHTLLEAEMPAHTHTASGVNKSAGGASPDTGSGTASSAMTTDATGGGGAHNNVQPYLTVNYIIKF